MARLEAEGIGRSVLAYLSFLDFEIGRLPAGYLGLSYLDSHTVRISSDAAGYGWFVDATPLLDEEFAAHAGTLRSLDGRMDLLTVILHEMGHFAGWTDLDPAAHPHHLMAQTLEGGTRRTQALDAVFSAY